jgi:hypothetical protein
VPQEPERRAALAAEDALSDRAYAAARPRAFSRTSASAPNKSAYNNNLATLKVESLPRINSRVGRTLLSDAFDFALDFDLRRTRSNSRALYPYTRAASPTAKSSDATPLSISTPKPPADPALMHPTRSLNPVFPFDGAPVWHSSFSRVQFPALINYDRKQFGKGTSSLVPH